RVQGDARRCWAILPVRLYSSSSASMWVTHSLVSAASCDEMTILLSAMESWNRSTGRRQSHGRRISILPMLSGGAPTLRFPSTHLMTRPSLKTAPAFFASVTFFCSERSTFPLSDTIKTSANHQPTFPSRDHHRLGYEYLEGLLIANGR